jgi:hypothetical protein
MLYTTGFNLGNTSAGVKSLGTVALSEFSSYDQEKPDADTTKLINSTSTQADTNEVIYVKAKRIANVNTDDNVLRYPMKSKDGVFIESRNNLTYRSVIDEDPDQPGAGSNDPKNVTDIPVNVKIQIAAGLHNAITPDILESALKRAISTFYTNDGTSRLGSLYREATTPHVD